MTATTCHTTAGGVWALGDVTNHFQLKHMANAESRIVAHNLLHPDWALEDTTTFAKAIADSERRLLLGCTSSAPRRRS